MSQISGLPKLEAELFVLPDLYIGWDKDSINKDMMDAQFRLEKKIREAVEDHTTEDQLLGNSLHVNELEYHHSRNNIQEIIYWIGKGKGGGLFDTSGKSVLAVYYLEVYYLKLADHHTIRYRATPRNFGYLVDRLYAESEALSNAYSY